MQVPLEISYRGIDKNDEIHQLIQEKASKLERVCSQMTSCRVVVEKPQEHQRSGSPWRVRIDMRVPPGRELVVRREPGEGNIHDTLPTVLRNAFDAAARQLKSLNEREHGAVKFHPQQQLMGVVTALYPEREYGFLSTPEGREIFFHRHSVLNNDFDRLTIGSGVRFVEEAGEKGPQASTVQLIDKPPLGAQKDAGALA